MPKHLAEKVVDHLKIDSEAPAEDDPCRHDRSDGRLNDQTDKDKVEAAIGAHRAGNLGVVGPEATLDALIKGQVDELLLSANIDSLKKMSPRAAAMANDSTLMDPAVETAAGGEAAQADPQVVRLADEFVTRAKNTSAKVTMIEDPELLQPLRRRGGVAALQALTRNTRNIRIHGHGLHGSDGFAAGHKPCPCSPCSVQSVSSP